MQRKEFASGHASEILSKLNSDRKTSRQHCDITIRSGSRDFHTHKCVLATFCDVDLDKGSGKVQSKNHQNSKCKKCDRVITISGHRHQIVETILEFMYTCKITIVYDDVGDILALAEELKIPYLRDYCEEFLCEILKAENCLKIREFAQKYGLEQLTEKAEKCFIEENFELVLQQDQFKLLSFDEMSAILKMNEKQITSEEVLYRAMVGWVNHDVTQRKVHFSKLFEIVKLDLLTTDFLRNAVTKEKLVQKNATCLMKLEEEVTSRVSLGRPDFDAVENSDSSTATNQPPASIYVGDLHHDVTEEMLEEKFSDAGEVKAVHLCLDKATQASRGFAFVTFEESEDAEYAIEKMNFDPIKGRPMHITWSQYDPSLSKSAFGCIYVKNLDESVTNKIFYEAFSEFGCILACKVTTSKDDSLRYGFAHYKDDDAAADAISGMNGNVFCGRKISVGKYETRAEQEKKKEDKAEQFTNLFIKNFANKLDEEDLKRMFRKYGELDSVVVQRDDEGNSRGFGFVSFKRHEDAIRAIQNLHGAKVKGTKHKLFVSRAQTKKERNEELQQQADEGPNANLYVKNIDIHVTHEQLRGAFSAYGHVTSVKIFEGKRYGNYGFVCFDSADDATLAKQRMNGRVVGSKPVQVSVAQQRGHNDHRQVQPLAGPSSSFPQHPPQLYPMPVIGGFPIGWPRPQNGPIMISQQQVAMMRGQPPPHRMQSRGREPHGTLRNTESALPYQQKEILWGRLYPEVEKLHPDIKFRITAKLLTEENQVLFSLIEDPDALEDRINEIAEEINQA